MWKLYLRSRCQVKRKEQKTRFLFNAKQTTAVFIVFFDSMFILMFCHIPKLANLKEKGRFVLTMTFTRHKCDSYEFLKGHCYAIESQRMNRSSQFIQKNVRHIGLS